MTKPMIVHADGVDVADDTDVSGPWVAVNLFDASDETDRDDPEVVLTLTSTEARGLAAELLAMAAVADAAADAPCMCDAIMPCPIHRED